jgi:hypothetical protein
MAKDALRLVPELRIVGEEDWFHDDSFSMSVTWSSLREPAPSSSL